MSECEWQLCSSRRADGTSSSVAVTPLTDELFTVRCSVLAISTYPSESSVYPLNIAFVNVPSGCRPGYGFVEIDQFHSLTFLSQATLSPLLPFCSRGACNAEPSTCGASQPAENDPRCEMGCGKLELTRFHKFNLR